MVTMGTGIGGAVLLEGRVVRGANGMAGEFGHMQVVPDGQPCECGRRGCWEQYSSGNALVRNARALMVEQPSVLGDMTDGNPDRVTGPMVTSAAEQGDLVARRAFASVGDWLGIGVANLVAALDPEVVVIGGGVSAAGDRLLDPARDALRRTLVGAAHRRVPDLLAAELGPQAGMIGGALLVVVTGGQSATSSRASCSRNRPTSVTMPRPWPVPRSASRVTVAGLMSTQTSGTDAGRMPAVATA